MTNLYHASRNRSPPNICLHNQTSHLKKHFRYVVTYPIMFNTVLKHRTNLFRKSTFSTFYLTCLQTGLEFKLK